jgi:hypothetical protein
MSFTRPKWYAAQDLAEEWGKSVSRIQRYTQTGQLHLSKLYGFDDDEGNSHTSWLSDISEKVDEQVYLLQGWYVVGLYYKLEEVERFEDEDPSIKCQTQEKHPSLLLDETPHAEECPPPTQSEAKTFKNKRTNDFRDILMKTYNQLASSQDKEPTWQDCYDFLKNDDSRKLVDEENYINTVTDTGIFTIEPEQKKPFISIQSFEKRFNRLVDNLS